MEAANTVFALNFKVFDFFLKFFFIKISNFILLIKGQAVCGRPDLIIGK